MWRLVVRRLVVGVILLAIGVGASPAAQAGGLRLFRRDRCAPTAMVCSAPVVDTSVCPPVGDQAGALPPAPPGYKWVFVQRQETITEYVPMTEMIDGRPVTRMVPVTRTVTRTVPQLVPESSSTELDDLRRAVAALQRALGLANIAAAERAQAQNDASTIQKKLLVTLTARAAAADTQFSVSSSASVAPGLYRIGSEIVRVATVLSPTTVEVLRAQNGTTATDHDAGTVLSPR
jgi:hypothetical protein